jgi:hypothetical protein
MPPNLRKTEGSVSIPWFQRHLKSFGKDGLGAAGGDRTHFLVHSSATRATVGLRKIQRVEKTLKVDDPSG